MDKLIEIENLSYKYDDGNLALDDINLYIPKSKKIALLGANGAGKSTLMLLLAAVLKPTTGKLSYQSEKYSYSRKALRKLREKIGFVLQDSDNQIVAPSVYEEISFGLSNMTTDLDWIRNKVDFELKRFNLTNLSNRSPYNLSDGQKKRICLASIFCMNPELIICDEPCSNLDKPNTDLTVSYLNELNKEGKTILASTHDIDFAYQWADHIIILDKTKLIVQGETIDIFRDTNLIKSLGLDMPKILEICLSIYPDIEKEKLPRDICTLKQIIKSKL
ncbi:MAG: energy-coupling factor ABC transporter ATP-binding protein [Marinifilaceae bacterium]|jgi:cobalt/nickel transport system ATP-binding protein|nr:energy-coupling factor ABC transporter ATP-binding protein [Marinifilaceae bacterium]